MEKSLELTLGFLAPTAFYLIVRGRRLKTTPSVDRRLVQDARAPVFYLRTFIQESQFFVIGLKSEYGEYAKSWHAKLSKEEQKIGITFEEYLSDAVEQSIGPFVALGNPEDYLPPEGATRLYATDSDWVEKFDELARRCSCILVEMGKSNNLRREFEHLRRGPATEAFRCHATLKRRIDLRLLESPLAHERHRHGISGGSFRRTFAVWGITLTLRIQVPVVSSLSTAMGEASS